MTRARIPTMIAGALLFAAGIAWMVTTLTRAWEVETAGIVTTDTSTGIVLWAIGGYCLAAAGSTLFRNARTNGRRRDTEIVEP